MNDREKQQNLCKEYRKSLYRDYPEVDRFEKRKRKWFWFLFFYCLLLWGLRAGILWQRRISPVALALGLVMGIGMHLIILAGAMGPKWKVAFVLYLWFFLNAVNIISSLVRQGLTSWEAFHWAYIEGFVQYPLEISYDLLSWVYLLLLLPTAMWLSLVPAGRWMAEESEKLYEKMKRFSMSHLKG